MTKVILLALDQGKFDPQRSLEELEALAQAAQMEPVASVTQKRSVPEAGTVLGEGKLAEARLVAQNLEAEMAIFDGELTGSQMRNLSEALGIETIDRTMLILEIFQARAITNEGKLQTQLALERYRLPRLQGLGQIMTRQGGGGGGAAGARRGSGETQLELDRRYVHSRIEALEKKLEDVVRRRGETRRARQKSGVPVVALVGYTNVGKSSLMNALCGSQEVMEADMLFATLDPTARKLELPSGLTVVLIDTVGFVSRLPHHLVEAFKATLEELEYADLLIHVIDASDPNRDDHIEVVERLISQLAKPGTPVIECYNKADLADPDLLPRGENRIPLCAKTGEGVDALMKLIEKNLNRGLHHVKLLLPYSMGGQLDTLHTQARVLNVDYAGEGILVEAVCDEALYGKLRQYVQEEGL